MTPRLPRLCDLARAAALGCLIFAGRATAEDWPHFLGPNYDLTSRETGLLRQWSDQGPVVRWQFPKGGGHAAPAVSGGRVIVYSGSDGEEAIDALDAETGRKLWRYESTGSSTGQYGGASGPCTNPVISDGRVYALASSATLHCVELESGKLLWKKDLAREYNARPTFFGQGSTPLVVDGRLIVCLGTEDQKSVIALDPRSGKELWAAKHPWAASYSSPVPARLHGRDCILAFQGGMDDPPTGGLLVIDPATGKVLGEALHRARMFASVSISSPVVNGSRVFVSEAYTEGGLCLDIDESFSLKAAWKTPKFDTYFSTAVSHEGYLYGWAGQHQQTAELVCVEWSSGRECWRDDLGGKYQRGSLVKADGAFLCLGENGDLAWLDLSPKGARVQAQAKLFHAPETWAVPVISDGRLFICQNEPGSGSTKPRLICYDFRR